MKDLVTKAQKHIEDILCDALHMQLSEQTLVIFDELAPLTRILTDAYRRAIPNGIFVDFSSVTPEQIFQCFNERKANDLVVLVQSNNFRLNEFRLRIELFERGFKTIEHMHLERMAEDQFDIYIDALAYEADYYRPLGRALKKALDASQRIVVSCDNTTLTYTGGMEEAKLNIGDYTNMKNIGGTFPIGEVFTEAKTLQNVNGSAMVFGFAGEDHKIRIYQPFPIHIHNGILTAPEGPEEFLRILDLIKQDEEVLVREFGLGLNRAMGKTRMVNDLTAFERQKGLHFSLGAKHSMYAKPGLNRKKGRYHVDIFIDVKTIAIDDRTVYQNGDFCV